MLQWLVQITCGNDACTMIMNVFGYTALGQVGTLINFSILFKCFSYILRIFQVFVLIIFLGLSILCTLILVMMSLNGHRAFGKVMRAVVGHNANKRFIFLGEIVCSNRNSSYVDRWCTWDVDGCSYTWSRGVFLLKYFRKTIRVGSFRFGAEVNQ